MAADLGLVDRNDEKNKAMSILLNKSIPTDKQIDENFVNFIEWDDCVLLKLRVGWIVRKSLSTKLIQVNGLI